jgi:hypothetical protein
MTSSSIAGALPTASWAQITLAGTVNGSLVRAIQALERPEVRCSMKEVTATIGQQNFLDLSDACDGTVSGMRLLTRGEVRDLGPDDRRLLMNMVGKDGGAASIFKYIGWPLIGDDDGHPGRDSTSGAGDYDIHFFGDSAEGLLEYSVRRPTAQDYLVVAATDAAGVEHPFIVKVTLIDPPSCPKIDRSVGPAGNRFGVKVVGDHLQVQRDTPFTIDLSMLCQSDFRHTFQVVVDETIPGTSATVNADGTVTFDWTDPTIVGDGLRGLKVTAWDETTGAPSAQREFLIDVRDVPVECNDVEIDYDWSELHGGPLTIPVDCAMEGDRTVLTPPFIRLDDSPKDGYEKTVEGGVFATDGTTVTFTPSGPDVDVATAQLSPWSTDPVIWSRHPVHGGYFFVDVRFTP